MSAANTPTCRRAVAISVFPIPHGDISAAMLREILRQAGISRDKWERL
jgi:predicted RNA binding protein YcfA (HicA-like mRNA interferase family)